MLRHFKFYFRDIAWLMGIAAILSAWYVSRIPLVHEYTMVEDRFILCSVDVEVEWEAAIDVHPHGFTVDRPSTPGGPRVFEVILRRRKSQ